MATAFALLVSSDTVIIQQFSHALRELSISPHVCQELAESVRLLTTRKFDALLVDLQLEKESGVILDLVRESTMNRTAVTFAIGGSDAGVTAAFRKRVVFVFERPVPTQSIRRTLRSAYGLILREQRRYFRCPIAIPITILRRGMLEVRCYSVNISEGGMAVSTSVPLGAGEDVRTQFTLPDNKTLWMAESRICWWKAGRLGIRFVSLSEEQTSELQSWLSKKQQAILPEFVARTFQKQESPLITALADKQELEDR
jgi:ActR/RegA family two-component response regulator